MCANFRTRLKALLLVTSLLLFSSCGIIPVGVIGGQASTIQSGSGISASKLPAVKLTWSGVTLLTAGTCQQYTIVGIDQNGAMSAAFPANTTLLLTGSGMETQSGQFASSTAGSVFGTAQVTSVDISSSNNAQVYFCGFTARSYVLSASTSGSNISSAVSGTYPVTVNPASPASAYISPAQTSIGQNICTAFSLSVKDAYNNVTAFTANQTFTLNFEIPNGVDGSAANAVNAYLTSDCSGNPSSPLSFTPTGGALTQSFYLYPETQGQFIVDAHANGVAQDGNSTVTVLGGTALKMAFTVPMGSVLAGNCYGGSMQVVDPASSVPHTLASPTTVSFTMPDNNYRLFATQADCQNQANANPSFPMAAGAGSFTFYFMNTKAEQNVVVSANASPAILQSSSFSESFSGNVPMTAATSVGNNLQTVTSDSCTEATVSLYDQYGNVPSLLSAPYTLPLVLQGANGTVVTAYSGQNCTGAQVTSAQFTTQNNPSNLFNYWFKPVLPANLNADVITLDVAEPANWIKSSSATLNVTTAVGTPSSLQISPVVANQTTLTAGQCYEFTITALDNVNNIILQSSDLALQLSQSPTDSRGSWYNDSDTSCSSTKLTTSKISQGSASVTLRYRTDSGNYAGNLKAVANVTGLLAITSVPAAASQLYLGPGLQAQASFNQCVPVTVTIEDPFGNPVGINGGLNVTLTGTLSNNNLPTFTSVAACNGAQSSVLAFASGASQATGYFAAIASGTANITANEAAAQTNANVPNLTMASQTILIGSSSGYRLVLGPSSGSLTAGSCITVPVQLNDSNGKPVANLVNTPITVITTPSLTLYSDKCGGTQLPNNSTLVLNAGNNPANVLFIDTSAGQLIVNANGAGVTALPLQLNLGSGPLNKIQITGPVDSNNNPLPLYSGINTPGYKINLQDQYGNPVAASLSVSLAATQIAAVQLLSADCSTPLSNSTLSLSSQSSAPFCVMAPSPGTLKLSAASSEVPNGGSALFTINANTLAFSVPTLNFGNVLVGNSSPTTYVFQNAPNAPTSITVTALPKVVNDAAPPTATNLPSSYSIVGTSCPANGPCCSAVPFTLAAGQLCTLNVKFSPPSTGTQTARIEVDTNAGSVFGGLQGAGVTAANISISSSTPNPLNFGSIKINTVSNPQNIIVNNTGGSAATFSNIQITPGALAVDFALVNPNSYLNACQVGGVIKAGSYCYIEVEGAPKSLGNLQSSVTIQTTSPSVTLAAPVQVTGISTAQLTVINPVANGQPVVFSGITVGATSAPQPIRIVNIGQSKGTLAGLTWETSAGDRFAEVTVPNVPNQCTGGITLGPNGTANNFCDLYFTYTGNANDTVNPFVIHVVAEAAGDGQSGPNPGYAVVGGALTPANMVMSGNGANFGLILQNTAASNNHYSGPYCVSALNTGGSKATLGGTYFGLYSGTNFALSPSVAGCAANAVYCTAGLTLNPGQACWYVLYGHPEQAGANLSDTLVLPYNNGATIAATQSTFYVSGDSPMQSSGSGVVSPANPTIAVNVYGQPYGASTPFGVTCAADRPATFNGYLSISPANAGPIARSDFADGINLSFQANSDFAQVGYINIVIGLTANNDAANTTTCSYAVKVTGVSTPPPSNGYIVPVPGPVPTGGSWTQLTPNYIQTTTDQPIVMNFGAANATSCRLTPDDSQAWYSYKVGVAPSPVPANLIYWGANNGENWVAAPNGSVALPVNAGSAIRDSIFRLYCQGYGVVGEIEVAAYGVRRLGYAAGGPQMASTLTGSYNQMIWCGTLVKDGWHRDSSANAADCKADARVGMVFANGRPVVVPQDNTGAPIGNNFAGKPNCVCFNPEGVYNGETWISDGAP